MNTLAQYMPVMREAAGRFYLPTRATIAAIVSVALLTSGLIYAARYPAIKTREAVERLATYNGLITKANADTEAAIVRLQGLLNGQPEWMQESARKTIQAVRSRLDAVKPLDPGQILADAAKQQEAYDKAQALIEASPFKGLKEEQIPLSGDGKAYLAALEVKPPSRFEYQRLTDGVDPLLKVYRVALQVQNEAELFAHQIDVRVNGDNAGPAPEPFVDRPTLGGKADDEAAILEAIFGEAERSSDMPKPPKRSYGSGYSTLPGMEPETPEPDADGGAGGDGLPTFAPLPGQKPASSDASDRVAGPAVPDPETEAEKARRAGAEHQRKEAERAKAQAAEAEADRKRETLRRTLEVERATVQAEMDAARRQLEAAHAEEARQRECTRSLFARARCAAKGRNPVTGERR